MFKIAIISSFLVLSSFVYYGFESKQHQTYNHYMQCTAPPIFHTRAMMVVHENPLSAIQYAILQSDYDRSLALCNMVLEEKENILIQDKVYLLLAYTLLHKREIWQAQDFLHLSLLKAQDKEYLGATTWLLSLTYLYTNNIEKCKEYLSLTLNQGSLYAHLAQELLNKL